MSNRALSLIKWGSPVLVLPLAAILTNLYLSLSSVNSRLPIEYLIPRDYVGWIRIEYAVNGYPALPQKAGSIIAEVPSTGILRTSSKSEYGWAADKYYYLGAEGERSVLSRNINDDGMVHSLSASEWGEEIFIGTKSQLEKFGWSYSGRPGRINIPIKVSKHQLG